MPVFIKDNKYDALIEKILFGAYFVHQFFFVFSVSALARWEDKVHIFANAMIIAPFLIIVLICLYNFLRGKYSKVEFTIYVILGIILLISFYKYRVVMVISNLFSIAAFRNYDYKKYLKVFIMATIAGFCLNVIIGLFTHYSSDDVQTRYGEERVREGLGFYYTSVPAHYYVTILLAVLMYKKNMKWIEYFVLFVISIIIFIFTDTKAAFALAILTLLLHIMLTKVKFDFIYHLFGIGTVLSYPVFGILSYVLPKYYNPNYSFFVKLNEIVTGRLKLTQKAIEVCGVPLFGQTANIWGDGYYIDSSFLNMLILNGLIVFILCILFMTFFSFIAYKVKNKEVLIALFIIAARSIFDFGFMALQLSPVIILFVPTLEEYLVRKKRLEN